MDSRRSQDIDLIRLQLSHYEEGLRSDTDESDNDYLPSENYPIVEPEVERKFWNLKRKYNKLKQKYKRSKDINALYHQGFGYMQFYQDEIKRIEQIPISSNARRKQTIRRAAIAMLHHDKQLKQMIFIGTEPYLKRTIKDQTEEYEKVRNRYNETIKKFREHVKDSRVVLNELQQQKDMNALRKGLYKIIELNKTATQVIKDEQKKLTQQKEMTHEKQLKNMTKEIIKSKDNDKHVDIIDNYDGNTTHVNTGTQFA